jgi:aspartate racemase
MRTLGLIGGTTWVSTVEYYRMINQQINDRLGGLHSARIILYSVDFEEFRPPTDPHAWGPITEKFTGIAQRLERAGADGLLLCANTPHMIADTMQQGLRIPLIHIAGATAKEIGKKKLKTVGLLGTRITMEQAFFRDRLSKAGIASIIPDENERNFIHASIFDELGKEIFKPETKKHYLEIIDDLNNKGAEGIIFGCTEIPLLIQQKDCRIPVFDTTLIHASAAVDFALTD